MIKLKRIYADIETSPNIVYSWRIGRKIDLDYNNIIKERAVICVCWKWEHEDQVWSLKWDNGDDAELLHEFVEVLNESDEAVFHNGDRFDLPWLRTRCIKHGIPMFPTYKTVDTLKMARSGFYFNSNRLDYLAKFLGNRGKTQTSFDLWKKVMAGDKRALKQMVEYCSNDVLQLEEVYQELSKYTPPKTHIGVLQGLDKSTCPYCGSDKGKLSKIRVTAMGTKRFQIQCSCGRYHTMSETTYNKWENSDD